MKGNNKTITIILIFILCTVWFRLISYWLPVKFKKNQNPSKLSPPWILRVLKGWCRSHILWKRITVLFFLLQCPPVHHFSLLSSDLDFSNSFALEKMVCPRECKSGSSYVWAKYIPNILPTVSPTKIDASCEVPGIVSLKYTSIGRIKRIRLQKIERKQNSDPTTTKQIWLTLLD